MKRDLHAHVWRCAAVITLVLTQAFSADSQSIFKSDLFEAGITVGPSNFLGDLGGNIGRGTTFLKDNNFASTRVIGGAFLAIHPTEWIGFRVTATIGSLAGDDALISGSGGLEEARKLRNSNFKAGLQEAMVLMEFYPTVLMEYDRNDLFHKFRPYGMIGAGLFHYNSKGKDPLTGNWVDLQSLHTEGQGFPEYADRPNYKQIQMNIPVGIGVKYYINDRTSVGFELMHRVTFTDYIDDVSTTYIDPALFYKYLPQPTAQLAERMANKTDINNIGNTLFGAGDKRGNANNNDSYYSVGIKLGIRLGGGGAAGNWRNSTRCPVIKL